MENTFFFFEPNAQHEDEMHREYLHNLVEEVRQRKLSVALCAPPRLSEVVRINSILWLWDPLELNHLAPFDEYINYVPHIQELLRKNAAVATLADFLYHMQSAYLQKPYTLEQCGEVAVEILEGQ